LPPFASIIRASPSKITIDGSDHVVEAVREGRTDIGLAFYPPVDPEIVSVFKMREPLVAMMSSRHPLAGKPRVSLADCVAYPVALPMKNTGSRILLDLPARAAVSTSRRRWKPIPSRCGWSSCTSTTA
jgi:DNA-binding transcriptional LysR family regulator